MQILSVSIPSRFYILFYNDYCRHLHSLNAAHPVAQWSTSTSTGSMRKHLSDRHIREWVTACDKGDIKITASQVQATVTEFRRRQSGATEPSGEISPEPFTREKFVDAVVEWIIADDQVCRFFVY